MSRSAEDTLLIFDCDGVLVDSEPVAGRVLNDALRELGLDLSLTESADRFTGLSMEACARLAGEMLGSPMPDGFAAEMERRTIAALQRSLRPVAGVEEALRRLPHPRCVASSGSRDKTWASLQVARLDRWFTRGSIFSSEDVEHGKPAPDLFLHAAGASGFAGDHCIVIEDSVPGVTAAVAAGMRVFGYAGRTEPRALRSAGATVFSRMSELAALIGGSAD